GGIEVQLTDAFFADSQSTTNSFVIPLRIKSVTGIDSVLSGNSVVANPNRLVPSDWSIEPKDYILYTVKYVNPWHGSYLRRGIDVGKGTNGDNSLDTTMVYHNQYVERDKVVSVNTVSMDEVSISLITRNKGNETDMPFELIIRFDDEGKCSVTNPDDATYSVLGKGQFVNDGDSWGEEPRDVMHLKYDIDFGNSIHTITDTIVMRDRGVKFEIFTPVVF
ncbi:MAG: DUF5627 domain-containing protein, partial [Prolixibacteraceae bacterium]|nr:DUF5627 domain-containing protein [Prolixibacteraceae bacterium]